MSKLSSFPNLRGSGLCNRAVCFEALPAVSSDWESLLLSTRCLPLSAHHGPGVTALLAPSPAETPPIPFWVHTRSQRLTASPSCDQSGPLPKLDRIAVARN